MRISRFVSIIIIVALILCSTSSIFASNVNVTNQGNSWVLDRETVTSAGNTDIGGLLSRINEYVVRITQRLGPVSEDGGINTQLYNMRTMLYSIMQNVINYLGPVTTPSGSKALNELSYMIWSATTALGPSVDGIYTNSSLILAQEQTVNTSLSSILTEEQSQTSHLANIRLQQSLLRSDLTDYQWHDLTATFNGASDHDGDYSLLNINSPKIYVNFSIPGRYVPKNEFILKITLPFGIYSIFEPLDLQFLVPTDYFIYEMYYNIGYKFTDIYLHGNCGYTGLTNFTFKYNSTHRLNGYYHSDIPLKVQYIESSDYGFLQWLELFRFNDIHNYLPNLSQLSNLDHLISVDNDLDRLISIIDNSTSIVQNDNNVTINTNVLVDDVNFVNSGVRRFKQFFDTGITAAAFGLALDTYSYDAFFKAETVDLVQTVHNQYTEVPLVINDPGPVI